MRIEKEIGGMTMSNERCGFCGKSLKKRVEDFKTSVLNAKTNKEIIVKKVEDYICSDKTCDYSILPISEDKRINRQVEKERRHYLKGDEITLLRKKIAERLDFSSKYQVADFLCLNEKAFTRWESTDYESIKKSTELLIRLAAHSKENLDFIQKLHKTNFEFKSEHYSVLLSKISKPVKSTFKLYYTGNTETHDLEKHYGKASTKDNWKGHHLEESVA